MSIFPVHSKQRKVFLLAICVQKKSIFITAFVYSFPSDEGKVSFVLQEITVLPLPSVCLVSNSKVGWLIKCLLAGFILFYANLSQ